MNSGSAVAFAELGDDDDVVKNRIGRHAALLQLDDEIIQLLDGHLVAASRPAKCFVETLQDGVVLAKGVGLLQGFDLVQVSIDQPVDRFRFRQSSRARLERTMIPTAIASSSACLSPLDLERLRNCAPGGQTASFTLLAPLDEVAAIRQRAPVALSVGLLGNRSQHPAIIDFELFEKIDVSHRVPSESHDFGEHANGQ